MRSSSAGPQSWTSSSCSKSAAASRSRSAASRCISVGNSSRHSSQRRGEADDAGHVERAAAPAFLLPAAGDLRLEPHDRIAPPHVERADALRAVNLVGREAHQIDAERVDVDRNLADGLRGVAVQQHAALLCRCAAISASGWMTPISLLASITETRHVSSRSASATFCGSSQPARGLPCLLDVEQRHVVTAAASRASGSSTALCSVATLTR